jgi:hypothetical protein
MPSHSIAHSIEYNEQKVTQKQAICLYAGNFLKDADRLTYDDKVLRFERRQQLNENVTTSQHISLNFDPSDKLSDEKLQNIAQVYMKEIGFERQPYLVYKHLDAGHPHLHIVTTHIKADGDIIEQYKLGENQSEKARILIEKQFDLVTTEKKRLTQKQSQTPDHAQMLVYGQKPLTSSMSDIIRYTTEKYKYSNLDELNAILRLRNVEAYPGKEGSTLRQHHGLLYRALDNEGRYIGRPLKASYFDFKPTLANLEEKFKLNQTLKQDLKPHVQTWVSWELAQKDITLKQLEKNLQRHHIQMALRKDKHDNIIDVAYIDFEYKCVFSSEELDEGCRKQVIQNLPKEDLTQTQKEVQKHRQRHRIIWELR